VSQGPAGVEGDIWVEALTLPAHNGCGHIRMQLDPAFAKYYSASLSSEAPEVINCEGAEAKDCIDSAAVVKRMISNYFKCVTLTERAADVGPHASGLTWGVRQTFLCRLETNTATARGHSFSALCAGQWPTEIRGEEFSLWLGQGSHPTPPAAPSSSACQKMQQQRLRIPFL